MTKQLRASYYLIGALLGRYNRAKVALPGGCNFGVRPIDQHIKGFEALGATVEWDEETLNVYFVRSDVVISVSPNGEISDVLEVTNSIENNSYVNHFFHATERTIGDTTYIIRNDMGILSWIATSYSQIVVKDVSGTENVIYDVNSTQLLNAIISIFFILIHIFKYIKKGMIK